MPNLIKATLRRQQAVVIILLLAACSNERRGWIAHPVQDSLPNADAVRVTSGSMWEDPTLAALEGRLAEETFGRTTYGALRGRSHEMVGQVSDAIALPDGTFLVLDKRFGRAVVLSPEGEHRFSFGRIGHGPGELFEPIAATALDDGKVAILDAVARIQVFELADSGTYVDGVQLPFQGQAMCALSGRLYVMGPGASGQKLVHEVQIPRGVVDFSFGDSYRSRNATASHMLSQGGMLCEPQSSTVAIIYSSLGEVHGYDASTGTLRWVHVLTPFLAPVLEARPDGGGFYRGFDRRVRTMHYLLGSAALDGLLIVQLGVMTYEGRRRHEYLERVDTFLLEPGTGRGIAATPGSRAWVLTGRSSHLLTYREEPWPQVGLLSLEGVP